MIEFQCDHCAEMLGDLAERYDFQITGSRVQLLGYCAEVCVYHAIAVTGRQVLLFPELCHWFGSCVLECPEDAIREVPQVIGVIEEGTAREMDFAHGVLEVGRAIAPPVIRQLKQRIDSDRLVIIDASPGVSCPVVEALRGVDFALLVTEPTPFGLHDLRLMVQVARNELGLPVVGRIPFDQEVTQAMVQGKPITACSDGAVTEELRRLWAQLRARFD